MWKHPAASFIWIFPVGRGNCAFLRTALNHGFILDMGSEDDFDLHIPTFIETEFVPLLSGYPGNDAASRKIAQVVLSHPHADHITECGEIKEGDLYPYLLTCPHNKARVSPDPDERFDFNRHGNRDSDAQLIETYRSLFAKRTPPLQSIQYSGSSSSLNLEYGLYYVRPPVCQSLHSSDNNKYGNSTSIMFYFRHAEHSILFPGDMTPEGMKVVLNEQNGAEKRYTRFWGPKGPETAEWHLKTGKQPSLKSRLKAHGLTVLVAPHHGLESCYSEDLYSAIYEGYQREHRPKLVVVSERRKRHENDGNTDQKYFGERGGTGLPAMVNGEFNANRSYLSTKNGEHIVILFDGSGNPTIHANKDHTKLLPLIRKK